MKDRFQDRSQALDFPADVLAEKMVSWACLEQESSAQVQESVLYQVLQVWLLAYNSSPC